MQQAVHSAGRLPKPRFVTLAANYPKKSMSRADLYEELGIGVLTNNPAYENTCGIRMSYAIAKSGVILGKGGLRINKGPLKGRRIEPGMRKLAEHLVELWGEPEKYHSEETAKHEIGMRKGVIAFFFGESLPLVGAQGHIDLLWSRTTGYYECAGACFFSAKNRIWFWPLD